MKKYLTITTQVTLLLTFFCISSLPVSVPEKVHATNFENAEFRINGNKRTKDRYIRDLVLDCLVDDNIETWEQVNQGLAEQCLLNSKLFSQARVSIKQPVVHIDLEERWTLLPIPYMYSSGDDYTFGLFLMENNLFGLGKKGGIGGSYSSNGTSYFLFYKDPAFLLSDWTYTLRISDRVIEPVQEHDDIEYYSYEQDTLSYGFEIGRKVLLPDLLLYAGMNGSNTKFDRVDSYPPPEDYDAFGVTLGMEYDDTDFKFYFNEGLQVTFEYEVQLHRSDEKEETNSWNLTGVWQKKLFSDNALQVQLQLQEINNATLGDSLLLGRTKGFRGIESRGLWVNRAQSMSLDYQIPVRTYGYGTWTIAPFIDMTHFDPIIDIPADSFVSYGVGGYLYLKNIAFPGVGLVMGYNDEFDGFFVSFSIGMRE